MTTVPREDSALPLRDALRGATPYGAPLLPAAIRLDVNENPYPPPPAMIEAVRAALDTCAIGLNRYPDRDHRVLRQRLAEYLSEDGGAAIAPERVWAANGSNEVMQQLLQAFGGAGRRALIFEPAYPMYRQYALNTDTSIVAGRLTSDFGLDVAHAVELVRAHEPSVVFLTSPNNPTGTTFDLDAVRAVVDAAPGIVVVDEAYAEFRRPGVPTALHLLDEAPRLVVTRTLSKAFGFAGARLGYMATSEAVVDAVQLVRLPYHLSVMTQAVATAIVETRDHRRADWDRIRDERDATVAFLRSAGLRAVDSEANFVLFGQFDDAEAALRGLADHGVLVRSVGPPGWLRVSIGTPEEMEHFRAAVVEVFGQSAG